MAFSRKLIVRGILTALLLIIGAWLAPSTKDYFYFIIIFIGGTLLHSAISSRLKKISPIINGTVMYAISVAAASFVIPFFHALIMGIAGLIIDPFGTLQDKDDKPA